MYDENTVKAYSVGTFLGGAVTVATAFIAGASVIPEGLDFSGWYPTALAASLVFNAGISGMKYGYLADEGKFFMYTNRKRHPISDDDRMCIEHSWENGFEYGALTRNFTGKEPHAIVQSVVGGIVGLVAGATTQL